MHLVMPTRALDYLLMEIAAGNGPVSDYLSVEVKPASCTDECPAAGSKRCLGNNVQTCGNYDEDICLEWREDFGCGSGYCSAWSNNYCGGKDVYRKRVCYEKGCSNGTCAANGTTETQTVETCEHDCMEGQCLSHPACWNYSTQCHGDTENDGAVRPSDLMVLSGSWYKCYPDIDYNPCADFDRDGCVKGSDFLILKSRWYQPVPADCMPGDISGIY